MERKFFEDFLETYQNLPTLWQSRSDDYKNTYLRTEAWETLLTKYKEFDENASMDVVKKKINSMRTSYRRELNKIRKSEKSGAGSDDIYIPSIWYFHSLDFLRDQESVVETLNTFDDPPDLMFTKETVSCTKFLFIFFIYEFYLQIFTYIKSHHSAKRLLRLC